MDRLPIEIQTDIFILLHQIDKIECMKVCRAWEAVIKSCCLFHTITITSWGQLNRLKETLKRNPQLGGSTKRFFFLLNHSNNPDVSEVLCHFPVLREVCVPTAELSRKQIRRSAYKNSEKYIEHLSEYQGGLMVTLSLKYNRYYRLRTLTVCSRDDRFSTHELFSHLVNAPVLKEIRIGESGISINDLETLHRSALLLEAAYFSNCIINYHTTGFFQESVHVLDHKPATLMAVFSISFYMEERDISDVALFIRYIEKKYPNLTELELNYIETTHNNEEDEEEVVRIDRKKMIYIDILKPFYQKMGPQLKKLSTFTVEESQFFFDWMKTSRCEVQNLKLEVSSINWKLYKSESFNQLKSIKKLTLDNLFCTEFDWLGDCIVLEELNLSFRESQTSDNRTQMIKLSNIVEALPQTVVTIYLARVQLQVESLINQLPSVKNLEFQKVIMSQTTDTLISIAFPRLRILQLSYCRTSNRYFIFPGLRLSCLRIEDGYSKKEKLYIALLVKTTDDNEQRLYKQGRRKLSGYHSNLYLVNFDEIVYHKHNHMSHTKATRKPIVAVTCASVEDVIFSF